MFKSIDKALEKIIFNKWTKILVVTIIVVVLMSQCFERNEQVNNDPKNKIERHFSSFDGSYTKFRNYIKENLNDPSSFEHVETRYADNKDGTVTVWMKYRGKNAFNATLTKIARCEMNTTTGDFDNVVFE